MAAAVLLAAAEAAVSIAAVAEVDDVIVATESPSRWLSRSNYYHQLRLEAARVAAETPQSPTTPAPSDRYAP